MNSISYLLFFALSLVKNTVSPAAISAIEMQKKIGLRRIQFTFGLCMRRSINKWSLIIRLDKRKSKITRVTNKAVNILDAMPSISTIAKPLTSSDARQ
ncbi:hypothetical protein ES703_99091 [subsurface metagenome]